MQLVYPAHYGEIGGGNRPGQITHTATAGLQGLRRSADRQFVVTVDQRFALSKPALLSAPPKKSFASVSSPLPAASATLALNAGAWFRRGRLFMFSPVRLPSWPPAGRNSTYPAVQILPASSLPERPGPIHNSDGREADPERSAPRSLCLRSRWRAGPARVRSVPAWPRRRAARSGR